MIERVVRFSDVYDLMDGSLQSVAPQKQINSTYFLTKNVDPSVISVRFDVVSIMYTEPQVYLETDQRGGAMKAFLHYDLVDAPVMIGAAFFVSSVVGICWNAAMASPSPASLSIAASVAGLAIGKAVSVKSRKA